MQDEAAKPLLVLMHGDRKVSTKNLARQTARKSIEPCKPEVANRHSGFLIGGTSPFGTKKVMPVYVEESILGLEQNLYQRRPARLSGGDRPGRHYDGIAGHGSALRVGRMNGYSGCGRRGRSCINQ